MLLEALRLRLRGVRDLVRDLAVALRSLTFDLKRTLPEGGPWGIA